MTYLECEEQAFRDWPLFRQATGPGWWRFSENLENASASSSQPSSWLAWLSCCQAHGVHVLSPLNSAGRLCSIFKDTKVNGTCNSEAAFDGAVVD